jgi:hypothetical protein
LEPLVNLELRHLVILLVIVLAGSLTLALALIGYIIWRIRHINLPANADPITALLLTPLSVVIVLDLLDLSLDFLSAPVAWTLLTYLGLLPLRGAAAIVGLVPGTQFLPTMTLAWVIARIVRRSRLMKVD